MRALVSIGDYEVPEPSEYNATTSTVVDSARNAEGRMIGAVIRDDIAKVECKWNFIKAEDWAALLAKFSIAKGGSFTNNVTFYCQDSNSWETRELYVSDRTANMFLRRDDGSVRGYLNARIAFIEV